MSTYDEIQEAARFTCNRPNDDRLGPRFHDMTRAYSDNGQRALHQAARETGVSLREGVYAGLSSEPLSHDEVKEVAARVRAPLCAVLARAVALFA